MSPEQIRGQTLDGRSDLFSVGVILYELLAGRRPFAGEGVTEVLYKIIHDEPPELERGELAESAGLRQTVRRTLAKDREQRPATAAVLADELSTILAAHLGSLAVEMSGETRETVALSRHLLREGRVEESVRRLREVTENNPHSLEVRRALRAATREMRRQQEPAAPAAEDDFPELDAPYPAPAATYLPAATRVQPETVMQPTRVRAERPGPRSWAIGGAAVVLVVVVVGVALVRSRPAPPAPSTPSPAVATPVATLSPTLVAPPVSPGQAPVAPTPAVPQGKVNVLSTYPVDVLWRGKLLARGEASPQLSLPAGRQVLTLVATEYAVKSSVTVDVRPGATAGVEAPELGRISIRANPDNCRVLIDGTFLDYPPILNRPISRGRHAVEFQWPDSARRVETVEVGKGAPTYVMGRKE
jgi:serine/threonine-protein kinase